MSDGLKLFGGRFEPQKGALKKDPELPVYATFIRSKNKSIAKTLLHASFIQFAPDSADDYFSPKVWEAEEGMFCSVEGEFYTDLFTGDITWNAEKGEPERVQVAQEDHTENFQSAEKMTALRPLPANYRAASLVLFGPVEEITATQYGQVMDLVNDDESSFSRELMEAISREPRVLALLPERQEELLAHVRETAKETAQWTDIKKIIVKWLDTPPAGREQKKPAMTELATRLRYRTAMGILSRSMDFDVCSPPVGIELRVNTMLCSKNVEIDDWCAPLSRTPGIHDYHPASIVAMIKTANEKLHIYPGELRQYIDNCIAGFDCVNPPQVVIDIACGLTLAPLPQKNNEEPVNDQTEQALSGETEIPAVCPARAAELDKELDAAFANSASNEGEKTEVTGEEDNRLPMDAREIEIAHALNDLLSGRTCQLSDEEAVVDIIRAGHPISDLMFLLMEDVTITEYCLTPELSDEEICIVAADILAKWSEDKYLRQKIGLDAAHEYRKPTPAKKPALVEPEPMVQKQESVNQQLEHKAESVNLQTTSLTYRQQLTLAALQGMCANPAYRGDFDDLPHMAVMLAAEVINAEEGQ